jgi:superfamily I DNA/RNA helicase
MKDFFEMPQRKKVVIGVAGAGKTTFAVDFTLKYPDKKFLYLSYGRENANTASSRFSDNTQTMSINALSKRSLRVNSNRLVGYVGIDVIAKHKKNFIKNEHFQNNVRLIESLVILNDIFIKSSKGLKNILSIYNKNKKLFPLLSTEEEKELICSFCRYWNMLWFKDSDMPISHEMYLKQFQITNDYDCYKLPYDCLIVDEYQDANDVIVSIIDRLMLCNPRLKLIIMGDPQQQIYSFCLKP